MRLAFSRFGESNASNVVILHGLLGSKRNWFGIGKSLSDIGFNVWLVDLRNHGDKVTGAISITTNFDTKP